MPDLNLKNDQGQRAEEIFGVRITQDYFFRARDLGAKWPVSDYYVELNDDDNPIHFIVQIKSTSKPINRNNNIPISITKKKVNQLSNYNAPTFLAGVDVPNEIVYLIPIYKRHKKAISKISGAFVLNANDKKASLKNLKLLKTEVKRFWRGTNTKSQKRVFQSTF